ncbi:hypothetical protein E6P09_00620 [Haloferax mediterranei ATCC 33500]|uniref:Oxidoreductase molybdopterin-binding domain-containing protein n=1 Tax=Haloferax mediterranei (strain ATCC 33500 / DSM 1411 / JCM 8866 / NBRC 14739 / NCIMB 2177 / R-4) TaxID=523841 RepID=M0ITT0_HALMT|nr:hypothetical protein C439_12874 [Haloferax mediterranei ATCC 33500]QCQ76543.1 hypothetical protein E6P09_00620 [Haloferax mediterranei ATCC 33500]
MRGDRQVSLSGADLATFPTDECTVTVKCASGTRHTATWTGIPVLDLLSEADLSDETTHVLVESDDGYRICIDVYAALDGLLAFARDGTPIADEKSYETRFIAPSIDGSRTAKDVQSIEARQLDPGTDPETLEDIFKKP